MKISNIRIPCKQNINLYANPIYMSVSVYRVNGLQTVFCVNSLRSAPTSPTKVTIQYRLV